MSSLAGKVVVVIGGTTGIGLSGSLAIVRAGGRVVAVGRDEPALDQARQALGDSGLVLAGDAADPATAPDAIDQAIRRFGGFDGLYHVAGGSGRGAGDGPLHKVDDDGWRYTLDLNLCSVFYSNRAAARRFLDRGTGGSVLNIGSVLASRPSPTHFATHAYAVAKAGIEALTRAAAAYYAPHGVRFNAIAPGLVDTPMSRRAMENDEIVHYVVSRQPLDGGRPGRPDDLDGAVVYFLSDRSRFVTGQVLAIDGGWSVSEGRQ